LDFSFSPVPDGIFQLDDPFQPGISLMSDGAYFASQRAPARTFQNNVRNQERNAMPHYEFAKRAPRLLATVFATVAFLANIHAITITVTSTADDGSAGTLRHALAAAAEDPTVDVIIDATGISGTILLTTGELVVDAKVAILGPGSDNLTVDANHLSRVFHIMPGRTVTISGMAIVSGSASGSSPDDSGGGIWNQLGSLTVIACTISGNSASGGGGIFNDNGGFAATLTVMDSTFSGNSASGLGGGILNGSGNSFSFGTVALTVSNSTFSGNSAGGFGGGILNDSGNSAAVARLMVGNSTFSGNSAPLGGGISNLNSGALLEIGNTILNAGPAGENLFNDGGTVIKYGFNLSSDDGSGLLTAAGDQINTDPMLGPLADNGGPTFTHALLPGSPAIDQGHRYAIGELGTGFDQRGFARPVDDPAIDNQGDGSDIGAFERQSIEGNIPPTAFDEGYSTNEDVELVVASPGVLANDYDPNVDDVLSAVLVDGPANSFSFQLNPDGSFDYLASAGFIGLDSFTYKANDGQADSNVATVTIQVSTNQPPTANDEGVLIDQPDLLGYLPPPGVLANDTDPDGDVLTAVLVSPPANALIFNLYPDGSLDYQANPGFSGEDTFTYKANDGQADSNVATVTFLVESSSPVNQAPTAVGDNIEVDLPPDVAGHLPAPGVLENDSDPDGDALIAVLVSPPANALIFNLYPDGSLDYQPNPGFSGEDTFTYKANDGQADSNIATVTFLVESSSPVNQAPTAVDDEIEVDLPPDVAGHLPAPGVLENDSDPDGDSLTAVLVTPPANALVFNLYPDGSLDYQPNPGFSGEDTFTYKTNDGQADSNVATVTFLVETSSPVNQAPTAVDDSYQTTEDDPLSVGSPGILANDTDPDGDVLTPNLVSWPANALVFHLNTDGSFTYLANPGFSGTDTFTYKAYDGQADSNIATVTITVHPATPPNNAPTASNDVYLAEEDTQLAVPSPGVLANDNDPNGDVLTAVLVAAPANSLFFHLHSDGSFDYVGKPGFTGIDSFTYKANDGQADSNVATVTIVVNPPNEADLHIGLSVDNLNPRQGDLITYTITVRNFGAGDAVNTVVRDVLSSGTTFHGASANRGHFTAPQSGQTGTVTWYLGSLPDEFQESAQIKVTVVVKGPTTIVNTVSVSSDTPDPDTSNNSASLTTSVAKGGSTGGGKKK
jgi:uncharacterized repeat protein (TIGR01451 family)